MSTTGSLSLHNTLCKEVSRFEHELRHHLPLASHNTSNCGERCTPRGSFRSRAKGCGLQWRGDSTPSPKHRQLGDFGGWRCSPLPFQPVLHTTTWTEEGPGFSVYFYFARRSTTLHLSRGNLGLSICYALLHKVPVQPSLCVVLGPAEAAAVYHSSPTKRNNSWTSNEWIWPRLSWRWIGSG